MKIGVIVAAHDGLVSLVTGVGVVVNSFVESFEEIRQKCGALGNNKVELICLAPHLDENSTDYNSRIREITKKSCESNGGKLVDIPTFSDGYSESAIWGGPNQWRSASLSVASYITSIHDNYDLMMLFAHDTIFSSVRKYIPKLDKLKIIWIPHSLASVFKDEFTDSERLKIEKEAVETILNSKNDVVGYVGEAFKNVLHQEYGVREERLIPFTNGLYDNSSRFKVSDSVINENIKNYRIPIDKKMIFSWGRCVYQKGYDILISACEKFLRNNPQYHLVLLMPTETSTAEYLDKIKNEISMLPQDSVTPIYEFNDTLPYSILHHPNLKIVVFPSRFEGSPMTCLEALSFTKKDVRFVYSAIPPLIEVFNKNDRAIPIHDLTVDSLYESMKSAAKNVKHVVTNDKVPNVVDSYVEGINIARDRNNET